MPLSNAQLLMLDNLIYTDYCDNGDTVGKIIQEMTNDLNNGKSIGGCMMSNDEWRSLIVAIQDEPSLLNYTVQNYKNDESTGMRAACFVDDVNNPTDTNVVFRGTSSDYEWHDNGEGGYLSDTDQQKAAADYVNNLPDKYGNNMTVTGHSKGGNKAQYATIVTDRIAKCVSYDGQGFSEEFLEKYRDEIAKKSQSIISISASDDFVNCLLYPIAGTRIYIDTENQDNFLHYHKPNILLDQNGNLRPQTEQSDLSKFINEYTTYMISNLDEPERSVTIDGLLALLEEGEDKESIWQTIYAGGNAISHLDDFAFNYIGEKYGFPTELAASYLAAVACPYLFLDDLMNCGKEMFGTVVGGMMDFADEVKKRLDSFGKKAAEYGNKFVGAISTFASKAQEWFDEKLNSGYKFISSLFFKSEFVTRDFSERSKQQLLSLVSEVENEKLCDFTDWVGDRWYDFEEWIGSLDIRRYINNVNVYHKKVIDKNNTSKETIEKIFAEVNAIDSSYEGIFENILQQQKKVQQYVRELGEIIYPANGRFTPSEMSSLDNLLSEISSQKVECFRDQLVQDIDGRVVINEELLYEYIKKNPAQISDAEKAALLDTISLLKDTVAVYETIATVGTDELGADILNYVRWISDSTEFESFTGVSAHYNKAYVNLLNYMREQSEDSNTFAASLLTAGIDESVLTLIGVETSENLKDIFGKNSFSAYLAKYESEHSEQYFAQLEISEKNSLKASGKFKNRNDAIEDWFKNHKIGDKPLFSEEKGTAYVDSNGNVIDKKDAPTFYKRQLTLAEIKKQVQASVSLYKGDFDLGDWGDLNVTVGEAEAHASVSAGLYVIGADGEKRFSPGVNAEVGASATALEAGWENQLLGDENLGLNADAKVTVGQASAKADATAQIFGDDGKLDVQLGASAKAEAIAAEIEGSAGVNILGGEVGVSGSLNVGVGAHADVGYRDGVFKFDVGASLGVGASVSFEVDVGGMVDTVCDGAKAAWDGIKDGWNTFTSWS